MDSGTSFDGETIKCKLSLPFYHHRSPRNLKKFLKITGEVIAEDDTTVKIKTLFNYQTTGTARGFEYSGEIKGYEDNIYGESKWGTMKYGGRVTSVYPHYINGIGYNMGIQTMTNSIFNRQHTFQNLIVDFEILGRSV